MLGDFEQRLAATMRAVVAEGMGAPEKKGILKTLRDSVSGTSSSGDDEDADVESEAERKEDQQASSGSDSESSTVDTDSDSQSRRFVRPQRAPPAKDSGIPELDQLPRKKRKQALKETTKTARAIRREHGNFVTWARALQRDAPNRRRHSGVLNELSFLCELVDELCQRRFSLSDKTVQRTLYRIFLLQSSIFEGYAVLKALRRSSSTTGAVLKSSTLKDVLKAAGVTGDKTKAASSDDSGSESEASEHSSGSTSGSRRKRDRGGARQRQRDKVRNRKSHKHWHRGSRKQQQQQQRQQQHQQQQQQHQQVQKAAEEVKAPSSAPPLLASPVASASSLLSPSYATAASSRTNSSRSGSSWGSARGV